MNEAELRAALVSRRFELHYQPQYSAREERLVGVEGLVRLRSHAGCYLPPRVFMPHVEQMHLIHDLGAELFAQGCSDAVRWPSLTVAINVSPMQFRDAGLVQRLISIADRAGVDKNRIEIEITEGLFFDDPDRAEAMLTALIAAGFSIALDDFGTGFSSLAYLLRFPVNKIKIDRSFVAALPDSVRAAAIVHALVALGRGIGLKIVAEGVETDAQCLFLRTAGCHLLQGFLFASAMPADAITELVRAPRARTDRELRPLTGAAARSPER